MTTSVQTVTERDQLLQALENSTAVYLRTIESVPEQASGIKLANDSWSILQIAEHVAAAEHGMYRAIELAVEKTGPADYAVDRKIIDGIPRRDLKLQAPEQARPKGRWNSLAECVEVFKKTRARTFEFVRSAEGLRGKLVKHPLLGKIDGHQMVLVMAGHSERHAAQIEEIKTSAAYQRAAAR